jgi:hypothetical protein
MRDESLKASWSPRVIGLLPWELADKRLIQSVEAPVVRPMESTTSAIDAR